MNEALCITCEERPRKKGRRQCGRCAWRSEDAGLGRERRKQFKRRLRLRQGCVTRAARAAAAVEREKQREQDRERRRALPKVSRFNPTDTLKKPLFRRAQMMVYSAVKRGDLVRPAICTKCGSRRNIQASHDDYRRPLDVEWLCARCHNAKDHANPKVKGIYI